MTRETPLGAASTSPASGPVPAPPPGDGVPVPVRRAAALWLVAVAAGVVESAIGAGQMAAANGADGGLLLGIAFRVIVYGSVTAAVLRMRRGADWARIALAAVLGTVGIASLVVEPVRWLLEGGAPMEFLAGAGPLTLFIAAVRLAHILVIPPAIALMWAPAANRHFRPTR